MNSEHPDLETLADIADADDFAAASAAASAPGAVLEHVAGCAVCTADLDALRGVRETLRSLPPVPMPPEVADRLEAALLAARVPEGNITPFSPRAASGRAPTARWRTLPLSAAAAIVVFAALIVGGVVGIGHLGNSSKSTRSTAAPAVAAAGLADLTTITSGTNYTADQLRAQVAAIVSSRVPGAAERYPGLNDPDLAVPAAAATSAAAPSAPAAASAPAPAASAAPAASPSVAAAPQFAAASSAAAAGGTAHSDVLAPNHITTPTGPLADPAALASCIKTLAGKAEQPVLVDYATFDGVPSTIIVFADPDIANKLDIYVEANTANCATQVTYAAFLPAPVASSP